MIHLNNIEAGKKDSKVRIEYNKYSNEDRHLERLEQMIQSTIDDLIWYRETFTR